MDFFDCWLDKMNNLKVQFWPLRNCAEHRKTCGK